MLYRILKVIARPALRLFCRKIIINHPRLLQEKGPLLLACNHPNSFLDSIILDLLFEEPIWSLARGDAFRKPFFARLLHRLKILPVYRTSEGVENLSENYKTFEACLLIFKKQGVVTIFSEGKCINEWHLRPLKKGTARLAIKAWEEGIPLRVLPVGINYHSFTRFGKVVRLNFGEMIRSEDIDLSAPDGLRNQAFNELLRKQLEQLVYEIPKEAVTQRKEIFSVPVSTLKKALLMIPAALGWLLHWPLYFPVKRFVWKRTKDNDHYDSVMFGLLLLSYPIYLLLLATLLLLLTPCWYMVASVLLLPFTVWCYVQVKTKLD